MEKSREEVTLREFATKVMTIGWFALNPPFAKMTAFRSGLVLSVPHPVGVTPVTVIPVGHVALEGAPVFTNVQPLGSVNRKSPGVCAVAIVAEITISEPFVPVAPMVPGDVAVTVSVAA